MSVLLHITLGSNMLDGNWFGISSRNYKRRDMDLVGAGEWVVAIQDVVEVDTEMIEVGMAEVLLVTTGADTVIEMIEEAGTGGGITGEVEGAMEVEDIGMIVDDGKILSICVFEIVTHHVLNTGVGEN